MPYSTIFNMPTVIKITGRSSSITNAFINSIIPIIQPTASEIKEALAILNMDSDNFHCSYCGDSATEWDHLRPLVVDQKPTGYISEIQNLVPSCGKCNQSKGNKDWKTWMLSDAPKSPKSRGIADIQMRIERINIYERWRTPTVVNFESVVGKERWQKHWENWERVIQTMKHSQVLANEIREITSQAYSNDLMPQPQVIDQHSLRSVDVDEEINKVKRKLNRWVNRPNQICCKILNKYLELSERLTSIDIKTLKSSLPELTTFDSNFDQMKTISDRNHAKLFELNGQYIEIWVPVRELVNIYHMTINQNIYNDDLINDFIKYHQVKGYSSSLLDNLANRFKGKVVPVKNSTFWNNIARSLNSPQTLEALIKGLLSFYNHNQLHTGGSVSPIRFLFKYYSEQYPETKKELYNWIIANKNNSYEPFGTLSSD